MASKLNDRSRRRLTDSLPAVGEHHAFTAEIPGTTPGQPAWRLRIEMITEAQGDGERLRLRAHLHSRLGEVLSSLPAGRQQQTAIGSDRADAAASAGTALTPAYRLAARGLRLALTVPMVRRLAEPLLSHDFDTWVELRASTADLADGAAALLPEIDQLKSLGIVPPAGDGPLAQSWAGPANHSGRPGFAQVSLLRFDRRHLPAALATLLGGRPFSLAAAIVNLVEETKKPPRQD
jgi:hypothetical protein